MRNLKPLYNQIIRCLFLFTIIVFFVSSVFVCHFYTVRTVNSDYNFAQNSQISSEDFHHHKDSHYSYDSCHNKEESLVNQNASQPLLLSSRIQSQNHQKFIFNLDFITSEGLSNSVQQRDAPFVSLENLDDSQINQLLTVAKKE